MPVLAVASGGLTWMILRVGLEMGGLPPLCWGIPLVLISPDGGNPFVQFTDNGQIIFPASDNSIFTYPNPPPRGFSGREEVPMIAVFWDNADFSRGVGTTFYQVSEAT